MTVFAAAVDVLFGDPNLGVDVSYAPPSGPVLPSVRAIFGMGDQQGALFGTPSVAPSVHADIRVAELATPAEQAVLTIVAGPGAPAVGARFAVQSYRRDRERQVWRLDLEAL